MSTFHSDDADGNSVKWYVDNYGCEAFRIYCEDNRVYVEGRNPTPEQISFANKLGIATARHIVEQNNRLFLERRQPLEIDQAKDGIGGRLRFFIDVESRGFWRDRTPVTRELRTNLSRMHRMGVSASSIGI